MKSLISRLGQDNNRIPSWTTWTKSTFDRWSLYPQGRPFQLVRII